MPHPTVSTADSGLSSRPLSDEPSPCRRLEAGDPAAAATEAEVHLTAEGIATIEFEPLVAEDIACVDLPDDLSGVVSTMRVARSLLSRSKAELIELTAQIGADEFVALLETYIDAREFHEREVVLMRAVESRLMIAGAAYGLEEESR